MKNAVRILCVCACLVIGVSALLPYFSVSAFGAKISRSMMNSWEGIAALVIAAGALLLSALKKYLPVAFLGMAAFGLFFIENNSLTTTLGKEADAVARTMIQNDMGYYGLLIGSIALVVFAVIGLAGRSGR